MTTALLPVLAPILLADIVNPVLFAFMVYAAGTSRPVSNSVALLLGHTTAYFTVGIVIALGLEQFEVRLANPKPVDFAFEFLVGLILVWVAVRSRGKAGKQPDTGTNDLSLASAFAVGAIVNFVGIPFAIPYFAALSQILKADISATGALIALAGYNIAYALPFTIVPVLRGLLGDRSQSLFERINQLLNRISSLIMPVLLLLLGTALVIDALYYFASGEALF